MKFSLFNPWPVYGVELDGGWPVSPRQSSPAATRDSMRKAIEISQLADEVGFDYVTVAEHHYHPRQLSPNPLLSAAALAQHLSRAGIAVLGATLPLVNPIRVAEEVCIVDALTGGRLLLGLFRGTPNEYLTYGTNPAETREVFEEAVDLLCEAWTQPEPFSWVGRHYDFRTVAVWPRPVQQPYPPLLVSANTPASTTYAASKHFKIGLGFTPVEQTAAVTTQYWSECARFGWAPEPEDILHRGFCLVADSDEQAEELVARHRYGDMTMVFNADSHGVGAELRRAMQAGAQRPAGGPSGPRDQRSGRPTITRPVFMGSPDTVAAQIRSFAEQTGVGHFDLLFNDVQLPYEAAVASASLFGKEVIPQLTSVLKAD